MPLGWIDLSTLMTTTKIPRSTWDVWVHRGHITTARINGQTLYRIADVKVRVRVWEARKLKDAA